MSSLTSLEFDFGNEIFYSENARENIYYKNREYFDYGSIEFCIDNNIDFDYTDGYFDNIDFC